MKKIVSALLLTLFFTSPAHAGDNGIVSIKSPYSAKDTIDRLQKIIEQKGITVALRWSHSDNAMDVGIELRPTELIVFGNPSLGSHLFTSNQTAGLDLPMKALAWQDENGQTWLSYNDPEHIARRHGITDRKDSIAKMSGALRQLTQKAVSND